METSKIFIYGFGGHGKVVADIIQACGYKMGGWIDDREIADTYSWDNFQTAHPKAMIALGIGDNASRHNVFLKVTAAGYQVPTLIHPSAVVSPSASIKDGSVVMPLAVINAGSLIGEGCIINSAAVIEHDCILEAFVHVSPNAAIAGGVHIGTGSHIGIGANVIQNITIGSWAILAAGSTLLHPVPDCSLAAGVPAAIKKQLKKPI